MGESDGNGTSEADTLDSSFKNSNSENRHDSTILLQISSILDVPLEKLHTTDYDLILAVKDKLDELRNSKDQSNVVSNDINELQTLADNKLTSLGGKLATVETEKKELIDKVNGYETQFNELKIKNEGLNLKVSNLNIELENWKNNSNNFETEKLKLCDNISKKDKELNEFKEKSDILQLDLKNSRNLNLQSENEINSVRYNLSIRESEIQRLKQEVTFLNENKSSLSEQWLKEKEEFNKAKLLLEKNLNNSTIKLEEATTTLKSMEAKVSVLSDKNNDLTKKYENSIWEIKNLKDNLLVTKDDMNKEIAMKSKLIDLLQGQLSSTQEELRQNVELNSKFTKFPDLESQNETLKSDIQDLTLKIEELQNENFNLNSMINQMSNEQNNSNNSSSIDSNLPTLYSKINLLKKQVTQEKLEKKHLQTQIESFIIELENKIPIISSFQEKNQALENELTNLTLLLNKTSNEKNTIQNKLNNYDSKLLTYQSNIKELIRQRLDLANQVKHLLLFVAVKNDSGGPLTREEIEFINKISNNSEDLNGSELTSQHVISERLVTFSNIEELQAKNMELLNSIRSLSENLENIENANSHKEFQNKTIADAKEAILTLQYHNDILESKVKVLEAERDSFKLLLNNNVSIDSSIKNDDLSSSTSPETNEKSIEKLQTLIEELKAELKKNKDALESQIASFTADKSNLTISLEKEKSSNTLMAEKISLTESAFDMLKTENKELNKRFENLQNIIIKQESKLGDIINKYITGETEISNLKTQLSIAKSEKDFLVKSQDSLNSELIKTSEEKNKLRIMLSQLQSLQNERMTLLDDTQKKFMSKIHELENNNLDLIKNLGSKMTEIQKLSISNESQCTWYQNTIDDLKKINSAIKTELTSKNSLISDLNTKIELLESQSYTIDTNTRCSSSGNDFSQISKDLDITKLHLSEAYTQVEEYKQLYTSTEESLKTLESNFESVKNLMDDKISKLLSENETLKASTGEYDKRISELSTDLKNEKNKYSEEIAQLNVQITRLNKFKKDSADTASEYEEKISKLQSQLELKAKFADNAQEKYESLLTKDNANLQSIEEFKEQIEKLNQRIVIIESDLEKKTSLLSENESLWKKKQDAFISDLEESKKKIDNLTNQNKLYVDQLELLNKDFSSMDSSQLSSETKHMFNRLRADRDVLETKLSIAERDSKNNASKLESLRDELANVQMKLISSENKLLRHSDLIENHEKIVSELNQITLFKESNETLRNQVSELNEKNKTLQTKLNEENSKLSNLSMELKSVKESLGDKETDIMLIKEESNKWRLRAEELSVQIDKVDLDSVSKLSTELDALKDDAETKRKQNAELEERFNLLKKQAHERLNASKEIQSSLNKQINELKASNTNIELALSSEQKKSMDLQNTLSDNEVKYTQKLSNIESELKALKTENNSFKLSSEKEKMELTDEVDSLKKSLVEAQSKLSAIGSDSTDSTMNAMIESMKKEFEEEKLKLLEDKTNELEAQWKLEKDKLLKEYEEKIEDLQSARTDQSIKIEEFQSLKKEWEEEYEKATLERIEEAKETLKKRIRLPSETKINRVIEKRKHELENEYEVKLQEKLNEIEANRNSIETIDPGKLREEIKEEVKRDMLIKFENDLNEAKKKSFEEGKQQSSMKTTLLERKISKLESQLSEAIENDKQSDKNPIISDLAQTSTLASIQPPSAKKPAFSFGGFNTTNSLNANKGFSSSSNNTSQSSKDTEIVQNPFSLGVSQTSSSPMHFNPFSSSATTSNVFNQNGTSKNIFGNVMAMKPTTPTVEQAIKPLESVTPTETPEVPEDDLLSTRENTTETPSQEGDKMGEGSPLKRPINDDSDSEDSSSAKKLKEDDSK